MFQNQTNPALHGWLNLHLLISALIFINLALVKTLQRLKMNLLHADNREFIGRLTEIITENLANENFDASELSSLTGLSRTVLNKRLLSINKKYLNQFIREIRLQKALELLRNGTYTASEVSYKTGFSSPAYFNTCFHEYYGIPPGKVKKTETDEPHRNRLPREISGNGSGYIFIRNNFFLKWHGILLLIILGGVAGFFILKGIRKPASSNELLSKDGNIHVVIMPFHNMTNDTAWNIYQAGSQELLIYSLSNTNSNFVNIRPSNVINGFIRSRGITNYSSITPVISRSIAQKLNANVLVEGSINLAGPAIRVSTQLINPKKKETIRSFQKDGTAGDIHIILDTLALDIMNYLSIHKFSREKDLTTAYEKEIMSLTNSPEAFRDYIYAEKAFARGDFTASIKFYTQALEKDTNLVIAIRNIAASYYNFLTDSMYVKGKDWCRKFYSKKNKLPTNSKLDAEYLYALFFRPINERIVYIRQLINNAPDYPHAHFMLGDSYMEMEQYDRAIPEFEKVFDIYRQWGRKPGNISYYCELGISYHETGHYLKEKKLYKMAEKILPDNFELMDQHAWLALSLGDTLKANRYINKWVSAMKEQSYSEAMIDAKIANQIYFRAHLPEMQEKYLRQAYAHEPENPFFIERLAYFLIDKERNPDEGMNLIEKALSIKPDFYRSLHTKGWGLYKQGKYQEAYDLLQKSWNLRMENSIYNYQADMHLKEAAKAAASMNQKKAENPITQSFKSAN